MRNVARCAREVLCSPLLPISARSFLQGFKYMHFHLRGREELIVKILNDPRVVALPSPASSFSSEGTLPRNQCVFGRARARVRVIVVWLVARAATDTTGLTTAETR